MVDPVWNGMSIFQPWQNYSNKIQKLSKALTVWKKSLKRSFQKKRYHDSLKLTCTVEVLSHLMVAEQESGSEAKNWALLADAVRPKRKLTGTGAAGRFRNPEFWCLAWWKKGELLAKTGLKLESSNLIGLTDPASEAAAVTSFLFRSSWSGMGLVLGNRNPCTVKNNEKYIR